MHSMHAHVALSRVVNHVQADKTLKESATAAEELINQALAIDPTNALALHLHIHIAEASSPQRSVQDMPLSIEASSDLS